MTKTTHSRSFLYFLALMSSLSSAGSAMTLLALSASFFASDPQGFASSSINLTYYLGIGCIGFFGGGILQRWSAPVLGIWGPLISAVVVVYLATFTAIPLVVGLPAIFVIFLLNGIDHPNNLRFLNTALQPSEKLAFFSFTESTTAIFQIVSPLFAGIIISVAGVQTCFIIDGVTYLLSTLPWFLLKKRVVNVSHAEKERVRLFEGFRILLSNPKIRDLNVSRLLNNLAYVTCTTSIPLVIAKLTHKNEELFVYSIALMNALTSAGFIGAGLIGTKVTRNSKDVTPLIYLTSLLGFAACLLLTTGLLPLLYLSAFLLGVGTYCFRISGMTLGQARTPPSILGPVIIAGDTIVRTWSFFVSTSTLLIFNLEDSWGGSFAAFFLLINLLPSLSLLAPRFILKGEEQA